MDSKNFLLEIGCEELPSKSLLPLSKALAAGIENELSTANLNYADTQIFVTPRRIAVLVNNVSTSQPSREIERQGPSYERAYDKGGTPSLACLGFAGSCNVSVDQLEVKETPKGKRVFCRVKDSGKTAVSLLPDIVNNAIKKLPIPRPMRWGENDFTFVRPVHWVVMLFGREVVPATILGKKTCRETRGHRFHHPRNLLITEPKDYNVLLYSQAHVIADYKTRKDMIRKLIKQAVGTNNHALVDENLLDEVTSLVEWPVGLKGQFNEDFLKVPKEVLITSMETHLKCFPVENENGELQATFVLISNIDSKNPKTVVNGYESVINARLADAAFFYGNDLKVPLESRLKSLKQVVFQRQLGTMEDRSRRISKMAASIAKQISADVEVAKRAGLLSKCDLISEMVTEFPKLQGIMGYYYALNDKESKVSATAIKEQYLPRFSGDVLPETLEGAALALAERLDTLVGILGINKQPTGDKDPFGLRRSALGVLRILIEKELPLDLMDLLKQALRNYTASLPNENVVEQAFVFFMGRLKAWYLEQGFAPEVFESVLACHPTEPLDFHRRIKAVQQFQSLPEASALAAANKRVRNILKKSKNSIPKKPNMSLLELDEEKTLAKELEIQTKAVDDLYQNADYTRALTQLSTLKEPVDAFFDQVMIMVENKKTRENRLALLLSLQHLFTQVADISLLP